MLARAGQSPPARPVQRLLADLPRLLAAVPGAVASSRVQRLGGGPEVTQVHAAADLALASHLRPQKGEMQEVQEVEGHEEEEQEE